jgi:hypothetical protein
MLAAELPPVPAPDRLALDPEQLEQADREDGAHCTASPGPAGDRGDPYATQAVVAREPFFTRLDAPPVGTGGAPVDPRAPFPAPVVALTAAGAAHFAALPPRPGNIPVLLFHEICPVRCRAADTYGVTQLELAKMFLAIESAGFTTLSIGDYVRAMHGDTVGLPLRPILVTFDDGRLDAYRGADDILRAYHAKATMYVITVVLDRPSTFTMSGAEVDAAFQSGRWDIQVHAHAGHVLIQSGVADGGAPALLPFYAARRYFPAGDGGAPGLEPFEGWESRAASDLDTGLARVAAHAGGDAYASLSFAVPYGNYGQGNDTNDRAIAPAMRDMLDARFAVWFTQPGNPDFTGPAPDAGAPTTHEAGRYTIRLGATAESLYSWLAARSRG